MESFVFLTDHHILITITPAEMADEAMVRLMAVDFALEPSEKRSLSDVQHYCHFDFPQLDNAVVVAGMSVRSDPDPTWTCNAELQVPFYTDPKNRLYVVSLWAQTGAGMHCVSLFIPQATFDKHLDGTTKSLDWEEWGPSGTRMLDLSQPHSSEVELRTSDLPLTTLFTAVWACYIFGQRYAALEQTSFRSYIRLLDFNESAVKWAIINGAECHDAEITDLDDYVPVPRKSQGETLVVTGKSAFVTDCIFQEPVHTSLPFRVMTRRLPQRCSNRCCLMLSEDNIILVSAVS